MTAVFILAVFVVSGAYLVWEVSRAEDYEAVRQEMRAELEAQLAADLAAELEDDAAFLTFCKENS